jgi:hypothetical protein
MKLITLNFRYRQHTFDRGNPIQSGHPIPATLYVIMVTVDIDAHGGIMRTNILPEVYASYAEALAVAEKLPSATGILTLTAQVTAAKALVKDPQIL